MACCRQRETRRRRSTLGNRHQYGLYARRSEAFEFKKYPRVHCGFRNNLVNRKEIQKDYFQDSRLNRHRPFKDKKCATFTRWKLNSFVKRLQSKEIIKRIAAKCNGKIRFKLLFLKNFSSWCASKPKLGTSSH